MRPSVSNILLMTLVGIIFWLERRVPLRRRVEPGPQRIARNFTVAVITGATVAACERPVIRRMARQVERRHSGLVPNMPLPDWLRTALALLLLDYTLYLWHILLHRVPLLWRFHLAHHIDLDLDASTAFRFHFGEFLLSIPWRMAQVALIGVTPGTLALWQKVAAAEIVFHHSNLRLPLKIERWLSRLIVTPRIHGIHHSTVREERDSNFSSGLTVWDVLHRTGRNNVPEKEITIGVPPYDEQREVRLRNTLMVPFVAVRPQKRPSPSEAVP